MGYSGKIVAVAAIAVGLYLWYKNNKRQCSSRKSCSGARRASPTRNADNQLVAPKSALAADMNRLGSPSKPSLLAQTNPPSTDRAANLLRTEAPSAAVGGPKDTSKGSENGPVLTHSDSKQNGKNASPAIPSVSKQTTDAALPTAVNSQITDAVVNSQRTDAIESTTSQIATSAMPTAVNSQITDSVNDSQTIDGANPNSDGAGGQDASTLNNTEENDQVNGRGTEKQSSKKKGKRGPK